MLTHEEIVQVVPAQRQCDRLLRSLRYVKMLGAIAAQACKVTIKGASALTPDQAVTNPRAVMAK